MKNNPSPLARATMNPSGKQYDVLPGQSLLDAGLSAGVALPFGCANGSCGDCRARLLNGNIDKIRQHDFVLSEAEKLAGHCLLCSNTAIDDVQIEVLVATSVDDISSQQLQAKLCRIEQTQGMNIVAYKFVRGKALRFLPGQRASLTLSSGHSIELPIASCPCNAQYVEFHLSANSVNSDELSNFSNRVSGSAARRERITISGPTGTFTLSTAIRKPKLFIAEGGEFAQLQGMIEQVLNNELDIPCALLWKATDTISHYRSNLCRSWHDAFDQFSFIPMAADANVLAAMPKQWLEQTHNTEVYVGKHEPLLIQQLANLGVDPACIYHPL